jgi:hypothetical protein
VLTIASAISIGGQGLDQLRADLSLEQGQTANLAWTLAGLFGAGPVTIGVAVVCGCVALALAYAMRRRSLELVVLAGILGTLLASPYHNPSDFAILAPAAWLYLRTQVVWWHWAWLAFGLLATYLAAGYGPGLLLAFILGWLGLLVMAALTRQPSKEGPVPARAEPAIAPQ